MSIDIVDFSKKMEKEIKHKTNKYIQMRQEVMNKLHSIMKAKDLTLFDLFVRLDRNCSGRIDYTELRSGVIQMGMTLSSKEFDLLWKACHDFSTIKRKRPSDPFKRGKENSGEDGNSDSGSRG